MTSKKILVILIIIIMTAALFTSCDETDEDTQTTTAESSQQKEDGGVALLPDLPEHDWSGYNFKLLTFDWGTSSDLAIWNVRDIVAEEETGEPINDAVYRRNMTLEEKYNFTIELIFPTNLMSYATHGTPGLLGMLRAAVAAGDNYFDAIEFPGNLVAASQEGLLVNLFGIDYLDLSKPWWDQSAVKELSIGNKLFFTSGDCVLVNRDAVSVMLFNKQLLAELGLENPYELVRNGKWTLDKFSNMARVAAVDLNGNGQMDLDIDRFGFISSTSSLELINGTGMRIAGKDGNDLPVLTFGSDRDFSAVFAVDDILHADFTWSFWNETNGLNLDSDPILSRPVGAFTGGRGLFMQATVRTLESLRGMETDFGILPMPWLDEKQGKWYHSVSNLGRAAIAIPNFHDTDELDRIGFILEAIAAESRYTVLPAHCDIQLTGKFTRDDESSEMLDIIFNSMVWDPGIIYGWVSGGAISSVSSWERNLGKTESAMQATVDAFAALN